jgi:hypothetical protein
MSNPLIIPEDEFRDLVVKGFDDAVWEAYDKRGVEIVRLRLALRFIAEGNVSPAIDFAQKVLGGADPREALRKERGES